MGLNALSSASDSAQILYRSNVASVSAVGQLDASLAEARAAIALHAISPDEATMAKNLASYEAAKKEFDEAMVAYRASNPSATPAQVDEMESIWGSYRQVAEGKLIPLGAANKIVE